ncbi:TetR/AcrR family transcriptional regulator [Corynebacterium sp. H128]|uniref:TetR/AcrR family transcriptional regulator n=1 Tax=unclassified Corynebacterium TaxID=2624378 RepID=UPI003098C9D1
MRSDALRRREAIVAAAQTVFAHGANSGTLEDVAKVAKVGIATVYRNFKDKDSLLIASLGELLGRIIDVQTATLASFQQHPDTALRRYAHDLYNLGLAPLIVNVSEESVHELLPHFADTRAKLIKNNRAIVGLARDKQLIRPEISSRFFIAGLIQAARPPAQSLLFPVENLERQLIDTFLAGLHPGTCHSIEE